MVSTSMAPDLLLCFAGDMNPSDLLRRYFAEYGYWTVAVVLLLENAGIPLPGETTLLFAAGLDRKSVV